jgi:hypothetical protein
MTAPPRPEACRHHLYGDCYDVDSRDDYGDAVERRVPEARATSCKFDLESACPRPTSAATTSASCGLNCETKDFFGLDILSSPGRDTNGA